MEIDPVSATLGVASFGLNALTGRSSYLKENKERAYNKTFGKLKQDYENKRIKEIYGTQLDQFREQVGWNRSAANRAYIAEQRSLNEQFESAALQSQALIEALGSIEGTNNATESYGRSADRIRNIEGLGKYGRANAQLVDNLTRAANTSQNRMFDTYLQSERGNYNASLPLSIPPETGFFSKGVGVGGNNNTGLMIANAAMQGYQTYNQLKPPSGGGGSLFNFGSNASGSFSGAFGSNGLSFNPQAFSMPSLI